MNLANHLAHNINIPKLGVRITYQFLLGLLIIIIIGAIYLTGEAENNTTYNSRAKISEQYMAPKQAAESQCDWFSGRWVYDNISYPSYDGKKCAFMSKKLTCEKNGRKDLSYQFWRWQPHHCDLPRFNAKTLMERLRNKRLMFVGDSVNRGQCVSLLWHDRATNTTVPMEEEQKWLLEYNASIEFYWAPLLVESNADNPHIHWVQDRIVRANAIEKHVHRWIDVDILAFNSYPWWKKPTIKVLWGDFESEDGIYTEIEMIIVFKMALQTWSHWLDVHVNRSNTQIFWISMSPTHERNEEWGGASGKNCYNEAQQIWKENYWGSGSNHRMMQAVEATICDLRKKRGLSVRVLNITQLSEYRKDGHLSVHRRITDPLTKDQLANPSSYADCFHWCLPGAPDT